MRIASCCAWAGAGSAAASDAHRFLLRLGRRGQRGGEAGQRHGP
jgi:hypothetical protein